MRVVLSQRIKREQTAEEMRILYDAMTRAQRKLIITACLSNPQEKLELAPSRPSAWQVLRCSCPAQWLLMGSRRARTVQLYEREPFLSGLSENKPLALPSYDPAVLEAIEEKLGWTYAHAEAVRLNAKAAVSRIGAPEDAPPEFRVPSTDPATDIPIPVPCVWHRVLFTGNTPDDLPERRADPPGAEGRRRVMPRLGIFLREEEISLV